MKLKRVKISLSQKAMTLPELLVATGILVLVVTGILLSYLRAIELQEVAQATSIATKVAMSKIDEIRSTPYAQIKATFNQVAFNVTGLNAKGVSYADDTNPKLLLVTVAVSWKQKNGRAYGEDKNLNGQIDAGEDLSPANNMLDSPVEIVTRIFQK
jgi:type II secretory pathway pseudopilin PulG